MNKLLMLVLLSSFSMHLPAQDAGGGMTEEQMQKMMQDVVKIQECMSKIDPAVMQRMEAEGNKMAAQVDALCAAGKRDEAQQKVISYGQSMAASRDMEQLRACGMMQNMPMGQDTAGATASGHVCDNR